MKLKRKSEWLTKANQSISSFRFILILNTCDNNPAHLNNPSSFKLFVSKVKILKIKLKKKSPDLSCCIISKKAFHQQKKKYFLAHFSRIQKIALDTGLWFSIFIIHKTQQQTYLLLVWLAWIIQRLINMKRYTICGRSLKIINSSFFFKYVPEIKVKFFIELKGF